MAEKLHLKRIVKHNPTSDGAKDAQEALQAHV